MYNLHTFRGSSMVEHSPVKRVVLGPNPSRGADYYKRMKNHITTGVAHKVPADLRKVLIHDPSALAAWEDLTPLARNEWICWVEFVKKPQTRKLHVERVPTELKEGKRRPCCWVGCPHR